jgi:hypothetical protein
MASSKKIMTPDELVESHKPKNFKYKYIFTDETLLKELLDIGYDVSTLDTICNDKLVEAALSADCKMYERDIIGKAKNPTIMEDGVIISKKMVTKADKKLQGVYLGFFDFNARHMVVKLRYERFDIIEIFNLI